MLVSNRDFAISPHGLRANHVTLGGQRRCCNTDEALTETTLVQGASNG
jgi:hypothetical protein